MTSRMLKLSELMLRGKSLYGGLQLLVSYSSTGFEAVVKVLGRQTGGLAAFGLPHCFQ